MEAFLPDKNRVFPKKNDKIIFDLFENISTFFEDAVSPSVLSPMNII